MKIRTGRGKGKTEGETRNELILTKTQHAHQNKNEKKSVFYTIVVVKLTKIKCCFSCACSIWQYKGCKLLSEVAEKHIILIRNFKTLSFKGLKAIVKKPGVNCQNLWLISSKYGSKFASGYTRDAMSLLPSSLLALTKFCPNLWINKMKHEQYT